jgi:hypothetical protein
VSTPGDQGCFVFQTGQSSSTFFIGLTANRLTNFETRNNPARRSTALDSSFMMRYRYGRTRDRAEHPYP